jgi:hypothetical protein
MKIYVAGPMTGIPQFNYPEFFRVSNALRELGHTVINPAETNGPTIEEALRDVDANPRSWEYYMRKDVRSVAKVDALCLLPGWQNSKGARLEVTVARALGMPIYIFKDGKLKPRIQVIGISGYARSGKDTIAEKLAEVGYVRGSFADAIRDALYRLNPIVIGSSPTYKLEIRLKELVDAVGWEKAKEAAEVRELLQRFGTEVGRDMFGDTIWIDYLFDNLPDGTKVVIPDVRYPNEADAITGLGGAVWRVERDGVKAVNAHISDSAMDNYPFKITAYNNGTIEELYDWVETELHYEA